MYCWSLSFRFRDKQQTHVREFKVWKLFANIIELFKRKIKTILNRSSIELKLLLNEIWNHKWTYKYKLIKIFDWNFSFHLIVFSFQSWFYDLYFKYCTYKQNINTKFNIYFLMKRFNLIFLLFVSHPQKFREKMFLNEWKK